MVRVPLPFRGVAVLLLAASTVFGQTPEPPADFLSLDALNNSNSSPDFLRQFSSDSRHPLLSLMVDGELTSFDGAPAQESSKLKPTPQQSPAAPKTGKSDGVIVDDMQGDCLQADGAEFSGGLDGCMGGGCGMETMCPSVPNFLPYACSPPCSCRKCQRRCGRGHHGGCGHGGSCGNAYLNWPCCPPCFSCASAPVCHKFCGRRGHKSCGGCAGCGGYGWGCDMMGDGFMDGGCGFCGCWAPQPMCCGHKCHRRHNRCSSCQAYGYPCGGGYGGGWDMGCGGWGMEGGYCGCSMPAPIRCGHKCHRRHGCANCGGYGCGGYLCPGWDDCGYGCGGGCGKHHWRRCHRGCHQPCCYPMMMPCTGMMSGMGWESCGTDGMWGGDCGCNSMVGGMAN